MRVLSAAIALAGCLLGSGCVSTRPMTKAYFPVPDVPVPRELDYVSMPPYTIETPDILLVDVIQAIPKGPYKIKPLDALLITATNTAEEEPIRGVYPVDPDGTVNLGVSYGAVTVYNLTLEQARMAIEKHLAQIVKRPRVTVSLAQAGAIQQIRGEHLVRPDGSIGLGTYGSVRVTGMTIADATQAIEQHLSQYLVEPKVSLDVYAYNSKYFYIITDGAAYGENVIRLPHTGKETVLDAIAQVGGLPPVASKSRIWIARPAPAGCPDQILPINWRAVTRGGATSTNYQLLPGDRIFVMATPVNTIDWALAQFLTPFERVFGVTLLGTSTVNQIRFPNGGAISR
jgi:polysaccharide export outer membrane protein